MVNITERGTVILYHGTDKKSALDILNDGLNVEHLLELQTERPVQMGPGWYTTEDIEAAFYFGATCALEILYGWAVIEMELFFEHFESLFETGLAAKSEIVNVPFQGTQIWFHLDALEFLNQNAAFRPYSGGELL